MSHNKALCHTDIPNAATYWRVRCTLPSVVMWWRWNKLIDLQAILAESGLSNLMADFPVLIIWQQVTEFLNSFHPMDAFHLTLWGFAVVAAVGEVIVSSVVPTFSSLFCQHHFSPVAPVWPDG